MELKEERAFTEDACTDYDLNIDDIVTKMTDIRRYLTLLLKTLKMHK